MYQLGSSQNPNDLAGNPMQTAQLFMQERTALHSQTWDMSRVTRYRRAPERRKVRCYLPPAHSGQLGEKRFEQSSRAALKRARYFLVKGRIGSSSAGRSASVSWAAIFEPLPRSSVLSVT